MKILKYSGLIILVVLALLGLYFVVSTVAMFFGGSTIKAKDIEELATTDNPLISPSGKYQLEIASGYNGLVHFNRFYITKVKGKGIDPEVVYASLDTFRTRDTLYFLWDNEDRIWVYSGDVGTFYWTKVNDSLWEKHSYVNDQIPVPILLKKLTSKIFEK